MTEPLYPRHASGPVPEVTRPERRATYCEFEYQRTDKGVETWRAHGLLVDSATYERELEKWHAAMAARYCR